MDPMPVAAPPAPPAPGAPAAMAGAGAPPAPGDPAAMAGAGTPPAPGAPAAIAGPEVSTVVRVTGAGSAAANGDYAYIPGQPGTCATADACIAQTGPEAWAITADGVTLYTGAGATPWEADWAEAEGDGPSPSVTLLSGPDAPPQALPTAGTGTPPAPGAPVAMAEPDKVVVEGAGSAAANGGYMWNAPENRWEREDGGSVFWFVDEPLTGEVLLVSDGSAQYVWTSGSALEPWTVSGEGGGGFGGPPFPAVTFVPAPGAAPPAPGAPVAMTGAGEPPQPSGPMPIGAPAQPPVPEPEPEPTPDKVVVSGAGEANGEYFWDGMNWRQGDYWFDFSVPFWQLFYPPSGAQPPLVVESGDATGPWTATWPGSITVTFVPGT